MVTALAGLALPAAAAAAAPIVGQGLKMLGDVGGQVLKGAMGAALGGAGLGQSNSTINYGVGNNSQNIMELIGRQVLENSLRR
jgi:hypothetical protein